MTPAEHAATVREALHGDRITDPVENWAAADQSLATLAALAERATELEQSCEKAIRERRSLEIQADDWHSAYDRAEARATELERRMAILGDTTIGIKAVELVCDRAERAETALNELLDVIVSRWHEWQTDGRTLAEFMELTDDEYKAFAEKGPTGYVAAIIARAALGETAP